MALHFERAEFDRRIAAACASMVADGLDGLLIFRQESMFYLTGYDTFGYVFFQCLYLGADGQMTLLTRAPDLRQARHTSIIGDIRIWTDRDGAMPSDDLRNILDERGCRGKRLGVEYESYGLTARNGKRLDASLEGFAELTDASELVTKLRVVKSLAEIAYVKRAAELADDALDAAQEIIGPGAFEGDVLAGMHGAIYRGGGDDPGNEFIIGSGSDALLCRYYTGRKILQPVDQITLEWAGVYRHYHAAMMRTICVGQATDRHRYMHAAAVEAMLACEEAVRPGKTMGDVFDAYAKTLDAAGLRDGRLNACGYSLGTTFAPNWMDWPMFYTGNPVGLQAGMVLFLHMIVYDDAQNIAMAPGHTVLVTESGFERLSRSPLDLAVRS
ncbi:MAG: Xaa-Pro peptidase family protein [Rhodospirillales bacterium]